MRKIKPIFWVLIIAFVLRIFLMTLSLIIAKDWQVFQGTDTQSYIKPAISLIESGKFLTNGFPDTFRTPGYSLFLLLGLGLGSVDFITIFLQIIASCWTVYLIYKISLIIFNENEKIAILSALLYALEPLSIVLSLKIMPETLFTSLLITFLYYFIQYLVNDNYNQKLFDLIKSAILLSATIYVKPITYYLPLLILIFIIILIIKKKHQTKILVLHSLIFLIIAMTPVYLWQLRNQIQTGYAGISSVKEVNLYYWHGSAILTATEKIEYRESWNKLEEKISQDLTSEEMKNQKKLYQHLKKEAIQLIREHPWTYLYLRLNGTLNVLFNSSPLAYISLFKIEVGSSVSNFDACTTVFYQKGFLAFIIVYFQKMQRVVILTWIGLQIILFIYLALACRGFLSSKRPNNLPMIFSLSVAVYLLVISGGPEGLITRYRHPIMPMICILAGFGLNLTIEEFHKTRYNHKQFQKSH
jgi:4-amino-4-deoxy-L-arabinose transferase-like glycosyltransferase